MENALAKNKQPIKLASNIKKIGKLELAEKVNLMEGSKFHGLSSIVRGRESSATLVEVLSEYYNSSNKMFELPNGVSFSFCSKEVADIIGMKDEGVDLDECMKRSKDIFLPLPKGLGSHKTAHFKKVLHDMSVDDEVNKESFKALMSYFLVEQVLLCARDAKTMRKIYWPLLENKDWREKCNWAKATWNHLHTSLADAKKWCVGGSGVATKKNQNYFLGASPVLETIVYERIEKLRPCVQENKEPPIQKYKSQRRCAYEWKTEFNNLTSADIAFCPHCPPSNDNVLVVERTPPFLRDNANTEGYSRVDSDSPANNSREVPPSERSGYRNSDSDSSESGARDFNFDNNDDFFFEQTGEGESVVPESAKTSEVHEWEHNIGRLSTSPSGRLSPQTRDEQSCFSEGARKLFERLVQTQVDENTQLKLLLNSEEKKLREEQQEIDRLKVEKEMLLHTTNELAAAINNTTVLQDHLANIERKMKENMKASMEEMDTLQKP